MRKGLQTILLMMIAPSFVNFWKVFHYSTTCVKYFAEQFKVLHPVASFNNFPSTPHIVLRNVWYLKKGEKKEKCIFLSEINFNKIVAPVAVYSETFWWQFQIGTMHRLNVVFIYDTNFIKHSILPVSKYRTGLAKP